MLGFGPISGAPIGCSWWFTPLLEQLRYVLLLSARRYSVPLEARTYTLSLAARTYEVDA